MTIVDPKIIISEMNEPLNRDQRPQSSPMNFTPKDQGGSFGPNNHRCPTMSLHMFTLQNRLKDIVKNNPNYTNLSYV